MVDCYQPNQFLLLVRSCVFVYKERIGGQTATNHNNHKNKSKLKVRGDDEAAATTEVREKKKKKSVAKSNTNISKEMFQCWIIRIWCLVCCFYVAIHVFTVALAARCSRSNDNASIYCRWGWIVDGKSSAKVMQKCLANI